MTSCFRVDVANVCGEYVLPPIPKEPLKTCLIRDTNEVKATKKVKKKRRSLEKVKNEWKIKSTVKYLNFKNFSSPFRVSHKQAQVGEDYSLINPP